MEQRRPRQRCGGPHEAVPERTPAAPVDQRVGGSFRRRWQDPRRKRRLLNKATTSQLPRPRAIRRPPRLSQASSSLSR